MAGLGDGSVQAEKIGHALCDDGMVIDDQRIAGRMEARKSRQGHGDDSPEQPNRQHAMRQSG